jgi:iron complex transport system permease protein
MKVTLDLDMLLAEGYIDQADYDRLSRLGARAISALAFNVLVGFGVIAVSGATLALLTGYFTAIVLGVLVAGAGVALLRSGRASWDVLAGICVLVGALLFGGGVVVAGDGRAGAFVLVAAVLCGAGLYVRSALLMVLAVLALSSAVGANTGYTHATYYLGIREPALTIVLFFALAVGIQLISRKLAAAWQRVLNAAAATALFLVNLGFWIGSLWGDQLGPDALVISEDVFALVWALALVGGGVAAWAFHRRWLFNLLAVFAGIHLYTQWFERLGATPGTVLVAGLLALGFALALRLVNQALREPEADSG